MRLFLLLLPISSRTFIPPSVDIGWRSGCAASSRSRAANKFSGAPQEPDDNGAEGNLPDAMSSAAFVDAWHDAEEKASRNLEQGVWEPILVAATFPTTCSKSLPCGAALTSTLVTQQVSAPPRRPHRWCSSGRLIHVGQVWPRRRLDLDSSVRLGEQGDALCWRSAA